MRKILFTLSLIAGLGLHADSRADENPGWKTSSFVIEATAASGDFQYHRALLPSLRIGLGIAAGPIQAVKANNASSESYDDARELAHAGLLITGRFHKNFAVEISPLRASLYGGNDWGAFYPSAHLKAFLVFPSVTKPRLGIGTQLSVIRVAGGNGAGDYPLYWLPVLVSYSF
jgi:hypothetical protein